MLKSICPLFKVAAIAFLVNAVEAQAWGGLYNMDRMLTEPHPFRFSTSNKLKSEPKISPLPSINHTLPFPKVSTSSPPTKKQNTNLEKESNWKNIFSEVRMGILLHDYGPFSKNEEDGFDGNFEILFPSPKGLSFISSPRPHIGISYNSAGDTSSVYGGLNWELSFWKNWFAGLSIGGMVHDGHLVGDKDGKPRKSLGCRALFREAVNVGYRLRKQHSIMLHLDHSSNASLCEKNTRDGTAEGRHNVVLNEGLENVGIRYGYKF